MERQSLLFPAEHLFIQTFWQTVNREWPGTGKAPSGQIPHGEWWGHSPDGQLGVGEAAAVVQGRGRDQQGAPGGRSETSVFLLPAVRVWGSLLCLI